MTVSMHRAMVKLDRPTNAAAVIIYYQHIVDCMTISPWFRQTFIPLAQVQERIDALDAAETDALTLQKGLKALRNAELRRLVSHMDVLKANVQFVADENAEHAAEIIESAGMSVKGRSYPVREAFTVRPGRVSGEVILMVAAAAKRASYRWQVSGDQGQTWKDLGPSLQGRKVVPNLVPQKTYWFRYRATVRSGPLDWSEPKSIVVR
jgi:hypothetical protein